MHVSINFWEKSLTTLNILHTDNSLLFTYISKNTDTFPLNKSTVELLTEKCTLSVVVNYLYSFTHPTPIPLLPPYIQKYFLNEK